MWTVQVALVVLLAGQLKRATCHRIYTDPDEQPNYVQVKLMPAIKPSDVCGGVLVHPRFVLTLAACLSRSPQNNWPIELIAVFSGFRGDNSKMYPAIKSIYHPQFQPGYLFLHNIALLLVNTSIEDRRPVEILPSYYRLEEWGDEVSITGYDSVKLTKLKVTIDPDVLNCWNLLSNTEKLLLNPKMLESVAFCAHSDEGPCFEEAGGPMSLEKNFPRIRRRNSLLGLITRPKAQLCELNFNSHGIYLKVASYAKWIYETIADFEEKSTK